MALAGGAFAIERGAVGQGGGDALRRVLLDAHFLDALRRGLTNGGLTTQRRSGAAALLQYMAQLVRQQMLACFGLRSKLS
ncbi:hypothetical protein GCM10009107_49740 [Ideonella azotifigens]|uniref:Uncharacterized protein n=1 Tax=Ideonella azotifigens TaxID=513160 RepID=A0ABP3VN77_9BURK